MSNSRNLLCDSKTKLTFALVFAALPLFVGSTAQAGDPQTPTPAASASGKGATGEEPTADAKAYAQKLFEEGVKLSESGNFKDACPKFRESQRLDSGIGTLLYLSDCEEQIGHTASAWGGFKEAVDLARRKNQPDREKIAAERAAKLEPNLSMLKIEVSPENQAIGVTIKRNGLAVGDATWGGYFPVDPGDQTIQATAPGYEPWEQKVVVEAGPTKTDAVIPPLKKAKVDQAPKVGTPDNTGLIMRISGIAAGGVGAIGLGLGIGFGIDAMSTYSSARDTCVNDDPTKCTPEGVALQHDASRSALVSTVAFTIGTTAIVGGALLFFLAPSDDTTPKVGVSFDDKGAFLTFGGAL